VGRGIPELRADAAAAFAAAVDRVRPHNLIPTAVQGQGQWLSVAGVQVGAAPGRRVVAAIGKAAPGLAAAWLDLLPGWADSVFVLTPHGVPVPDAVRSAATVRHGAHPYPDAAGEAAARELLALAGTLGTDDLLLVLLSGGGSALLAAPENGLTLADVIATTRALLSAGAPITAVNAVRRQILAAGGGGLASAAHPARVFTAVLSDVLGDPLPDIASGPTVASPTTAADALAVLERFGVATRVPPPVTAHLRARAGDPTSANTTWTVASRVVLLANNRTAVDAAAGALIAAGYDVLSPSQPLAGEASARGRQLGGLAAALAPRRPTALVLGGETTVTVRGSGRGGRNQELAVAAALQLAGAGPAVLLAAGTDGIDGFSDNAGAIVDPGTVDRMDRAGVDPLAALAGNDSATALEAVDDALVTGPTGTNVCDITMVLVGG